jgi:hypothetical protein
MSVRARTGAALGAVAAVSVFMAFRPFSMALSGDYAMDAGPPIQALLHGDLARAAAEQPLMGSFSILLRLPFAALASLGDGSVLLTYRLGAIPLVFIAGLLALWVAREMGRRGQSDSSRLALVAIVLVGPVTFFALDEGHPEELLTASLCIGGVLAATRGRPLPAAVLLGLALATKPWALVAVPPVLLAAGAARMKIAGVALAIAAVLTLPLLAANPSGFSRTASAAQGVGLAKHGPIEARPYTIWRPFADPSTTETHRTSGTRELLDYELPSVFARASHAAIVLLPIVLALLLWRRRPGVAREDALLLLAFCLLLRCLLDPIDAPYYHLPFIFALAVWEGLRLRGLPVVSILVSVLVLLSLHHEMVGAIQFLNVGAWIPVHVFYLSWAVPLAVGLAVRLYAPGLLEGARRWLVRGPQALRIGRAPIGSHS